MRAHRQALTPVAISLRLNESGRETLGEVLGKQCVAAPVSALAIGGNDDAPKVVVIPTPQCKTVQFTYSADRGQYGRV